MTRRYTKMTPEKLERERDKLARDLAVCKIARDGWMKASDEAQARIRERDRAVKLLRRARHWMNEAVGRNWQTHDAVDPGLFDSIDAALSLNDKENGT